jgi:hypothetical protein
VDFDILARSQKLKLDINGKELNDPMVERAMSRTAQLAESIILDKTEKGKDFDDRPFKPYSSKGRNGGYLGWRKRLGKSTTPNLYDTGQMLASITSKTKGGVATIFFSNADAAKKAAFNNKKRPFFKLSKRTKDRLTKFFIRNLT